MFGDELPRMPSEYMRSNVFLGASFMSTYQATEAWREGYAENVLWGRDYPHIEGTWVPSEDPDAEPNTKLALRHVFSNVPTREALLMAGENAIGVYGLDAAYMASVADRIGAPTAADLSVPLDKVPGVGHTIAFVGQAGPRPIEPRRLERNARLRA
jgi:hypothetical protein